VTERGKQTDATRSLTLLHELTCDVIDGRDMIGVNGMPEPNAQASSTAPSATWPFAQCAGRLQSATVRLLPLCSEVIALFNSRSERQQNQSFRIV
jgi:hypothetical protein